MEKNQTSSPTQAVSNRPKEELISPGALQLRFVLECKAKAFTNQWRRPVFRSRVFHDGGALAVLGAAQPRCTAVHAGYNFLSEHQCVSEALHYRLVDATAFFFTVRDLPCAIVWRRRHGRVSDAVRGAMIRVNVSAQLGSEMRKLLNLTCVVL